MKKTEILSYIAIVLSVIAIVMCSCCCMGCKKGKMHKGMKHHGPQPEMIMHGEHARPDMRRNNRAGEKFRGGDHKGDRMRPNMRRENKSGNKAHDGAKQND